MWTIISLAAGAAVAIAAALIVRQRRRWRQLYIAYRLQDFFGVSDSSRIRVRQRSFPSHVMPDVKDGLDRWLSEIGASPSPVGVPLRETMFSNNGIASLLAPTDGWPQASAVEYLAFDVGDDRTVECPAHALWLFDVRHLKVAVFWTQTMSHSANGWVTRVKIEIAHLTETAGDHLAETLFARIEDGVRKSTTYRGKVLSLESRDDYEGHAGGIMVHRLRRVERADVVLAESTLALLERNLLRFVAQRDALRRIGMPTKKGLLLYGPPGTGKTHTIHYLIASLAGHTTLLVTAEQLGKLDEYMTLARLLQPCLMVVEDVDLIAKSRDEADLCQQALLNRLLNEMDGLKEDADILFLLTTNRPESLEAALAARPGRVDQAIEFPLPDAACRERLVRLYACGAAIAPEVVDATVSATGGVSASFIKELMRRGIQFHLECRPDAPQPEILQNDVDQALEELLWSSGALNRRLLGAGEVQHDD